MKRITVLLLAALVIIGNVGCKKESKSDPVFTPDEPLDFVFEGGPYVFNKIRIKTNLKESDKLTWDFGDGNNVTAIGTGIEHTYQNAGRYTVKLTVDEGRGGTLEKFIDIGNGTARLAGDRKWSFLLSRNKVGFPIDHIPPSKHPTTFALNIVNDNKITIPNLPAIPAKGPYTVELKKVDANELHYVTADSFVTLTYNIEELRAVIRVKIASNDTTYKLDGSTDILN